MKKCLNCMSEMARKDEICPLCGWDGQDNQEGCLPAGTILQGRYIIGTSRRMRIADIQYIAWDALFSRKVYVMEYFPSQIAERFDSEEILVEEYDQELLEQGVERFLKQKDKLILMDQIHGLLNVLAGFRANHTAYMILEYPGEKTLEDVLRAESPWSLLKTERLLKNLVRPLMAAYQSKMIHGQLSADCCYLTMQGNFKVGFFNEALYVTEFEEESVCRSIDCFELAHIAGAALTGIDLWESQSVDDSLEMLEEEETTSCVQDALADALSEDVSWRMESPQEFLDRFTDEVTVEFPETRKNNKKRN